MSPGKNGISGDTVNSLTPTFVWEKAPDARYDAVELGVYHGAVVEAVVQVQNDFSHIDSL